MRRLFLHVGMPKTATTTIQELSARHRGWLLERGVFYPSLRDPRTGAVSINHRFVSERLTAPLRSDAFQGLESYWAAEMAPQLREHPRANALISSEGFARLAIQPGAKRVAALKRCLAGFEVTVVVYLRRQDRWLEAMHNQDVKAARETRSLAEYVTRTLEMRSADYLVQLDFWARHFGSRNVSVRVFEPAQLHGRDVVADFLHEVGIDDLAGLPRVEPRNERLSPSLVRLKRALNPHLSDASTRRAVRFALSQLQRIVGDPGGQAMPPAMASRIMRDFASSNAEVARRFLGRDDGVLFGDAGPQKS